jgi:hypothetical protein
MTLSSISATVLWAILQIPVPAVSGSKATMKKLVGFFAGDLEAHEAEPLSRNNWLLALTALDYGSKLHGSPRELRLFFLVGQFTSQSFQIFIGLLQTRACLVNGSKHLDVEEPNVRFGFVRFQELLDTQQFVVERTLRRIVL